MSGRHLNPDALRLEETFFAEENSKLLEKLREEARSKERRDALRDALKVDDEGVLDALVELDLYPETAVAFSLVPLVEVAWADGYIEAKEREAVLKAANSRGIVKGSTTCQLLENWLEQRPGPEMLETWKAYVRAVVSAMREDRRSIFKTGVLAQAREIAEAAGGFLGLGSKVSAVEEKVLADLESAFE